jgi:F0F1-type ATP synthase assembly protein I
METILLYIFGFIMAMTLILWMIPGHKIKDIGGFFAVVLPRIPFVGMIKAYLDAKNKGAKKQQ